MEWFENLGAGFFVGLIVGAAVVMVVGWLLVRRQGRKLMFRITDSDSKDRRPPKS